jgi:6-pyruvoyltetrahydropterin/6-carboxytetrahydropterin synthase
MKAYKQFTFDAAHQLPDWPGVHGHSYTAEVWFEGPASNGYVVPERELSQRIEAVRLQLDHSMLNDLIPLPTSENIARWLWAELKQFEGLCLIRIYRGSVGFGVEYSRDDAKSEETK